MFLSIFIYKMMEIIGSTIQIGISSIKSLLAYVSDFFFNASKMIVANPSENGEVLRVIPSTQTGMAQVIIPQGQLADVNSTRGE